MTPGFGPALGGTRFYPYASEAEALTDVLRSSQGMTHKAAAAGIALGGGKAVIIGDPATVKTSSLLRAYGRFVDSLSGRYLTAADVGTTAQDLDVVATATRYVAGSNGGSGDSGFSTAYGVFLRDAVHRRASVGQRGLPGAESASRALARSACTLVALLLEDGAQVIVSGHVGGRPDSSARSAPAGHDPAPRARRTCRYLRPVRARGHAHPLVGRSGPCEHCVRRREQPALLASSVATLLQRRGITWVPDYVANAGGLVQVAGEIWNRTVDEVRSDVAGIATTVRTILARSEGSDRLPSEVAAEIVGERLAAAPSRQCEEVRA